MATQPEQKSVAPEAPALVEADDFAAVLKQSFKPRSERAASEVENAVQTLVTSQQQSVSGVNLDEEMTNLMSFQRAYQASAHVVTTVDQMIQTILAMKA